MTVQEVFVNLNSLLIILLSSITYTKDIRPIIDKKCSQCHQYMGDKDWTNYDNVKAKCSLFKERLYIKKDMPPGNVTNVTDDERELFKNFVDNSCPK